MKLYHGSNIRIVTPDLSFSKPYKDFGQGFYLSDNYQQAMELAKSRVEITQKGEAVVSEFLFDETLLHDSKLRVKIFEDYSEEWVQFVIMNRDEKRQQPC
ncbi:MAG: DUF3990 domain-containing protein, partial [Bacteroidaceae bacterium]|nr:DUF3990 domain-containing protein [Bacteroidaceae bacterium]